MSAPPGPKRGDTPGRRTEGDADNIAGQRHRHGLTAVNYAEAIDCPFVCSIGRRSCPWECRLFEVGSTS